MMQFPAAADLQGVATLDHLGCILAQGPDAVSFLQGQLSNDVALLGAQQARLAAYCNPQGRMLASFWVVKPDAERVLLVCHRSVLAPTLKRLSMFVLRAKVTLRDATPEWQICGAVGSAINPALDRTAAPWTQALSDETRIISLYAGAGVARQCWLSPAPAPCPAQPPLPLEHWQWLDTLSGVVTVSAPVVGSFVPQMLNYESVGGISFKKGCYPGQEVVARSQFRGTLKRRTFLANLEGLAAAGDPVYAASQGDDPVGLVAQAALAPGGGAAALLVLQLAAAGATDLRVGAAEGTRAELRPLPYPLRDDL